MSRDRIIEQLSGGPGTLQFGKDTKRFGRTAALVFGAGTAANPVLHSVADKNFIGYWCSSSAASGTSRLAYLRLYLTGGAGGEALRAFTTNSDDTPADTVNGAHISLSYGTSAGNITGMAQAIRATHHLPTGRTIGGTIGAVTGEFYADGTAPAVSNAACFRALIAGNSTGVGVLDDQVALFAIDGVTINTGNMVATVSDHAATHLIRIKINGTNYDLLATSTRT